MKRRDFLKLMGVAGAATMSTSCIETYHWMGTKSRKRHSYLTADKEEAANGEARYASTCMECSGNCGVEIRVAEGQAVKVDGNIDHPDNQGALCIRGQASLSRLYDPQRLRAPQMKNADGVLEDTTWDKAYIKIVKALRDSKEKNYYLSGKTSGSLSKLIDEFCKSTKVEKLAEFEPYAHENLRMANKTVFGIDGLPQYDIENSDVMVTIGADVIEDSVSNAVQFGKVKKKENWKWFHLAPHLTASGLKANKRLNIKAESEVYLLRWLIGKLAGSFKNTISDEMLKSITASDDDVKKVGVDEKKLNAVLKALKSAKNPLVVSGGPATSSESGLEVAVLTALLQWGLGAKTLNFTHRQDYSTVGSRTDITNTAKLLREKKVGVLFVSRCNPNLHVPAFQVSFANAALTVGMGLKLDETLSECDVVLPMSHYTESLDDIVPHRGILNLVQPVAKAQGTQQEGDMLLEMVSAYDANSSLPASYEDYLYDQWSQLDPGKVFVQDKFLEKGFYNVEVEEAKPSFDTDAVTKFLKDAKLSPKLVEGNTLFITPSVRFFDGRSKNISLLSEIPDTLTTITYGQWVSISQKTAEKMRIKDCDEVKITSGNISFTRPAKVQPVMAEGMLTIQETHLSGLLGADDRSGQAYACLHEVKIEKTGRSIEIPILSGSMESRDDGSIYGRSNGINRRGVVPYNYDPHGHGTKKHDPKDDHGKNGTKEDHDAHDSSKDHIEHEARQTLYPDNHDEYAEKTGQRSPYRWAMAVDLDSCNGCSACVAACYIENNISISGAEQHLLGREMSWLRFEPYVYTGEDNQDDLEIIPMLCQQCENAPCESVCPVFAAYHNPDGLNAQIYNRCVGTRYCANNCPYKVRRFNYFDNGYKGRHLPLHTMHNPDVYVRSKGIMEKCTFCVHRIRAAKDLAKDEKENGIKHGVLNEQGILKDGYVEPACAQTCATGAIVFGNILDEDSKVYKMAHKEEAHRIFELTGVGPSVYYLGKKGSKNDAGTHG